MKVGPVGAPVPRWPADYLEVVRDVAREADRIAPLLRERRGDVVVNVHSYALPAYEAYLRRYFKRGRPRILALSMNPARNGAVQSGIPFTDAPTARRILPDFDELVPRPKRLRTERVEMSGQKLLAWAQAEFGGIEGLYERLLFPIAFPLAILRGPNLLNVPLPALRGDARRAADAFYERNAPRLVEAARPPGLLFFGDYAAQRWRRLVAQEPRLASIPFEVTHHPAARITNERKFADWTAALDRIESRSLSRPA